MRRSPRWNNRGEEQFLIAQTGGFGCFYLFTATNPMPAAVAERKGWFIHLATSYMKDKGGVELPGFSITQTPPLWRLEAMFDHRSNSVFRTLTAVSDGTEVGICVNKELMREPMPAYEPAGDNWFEWNKNQ